MTKKKKIVLSIVSIFLVALMIAVLIYYFGENHHEYEKISQEEFLIPGLNTSFVPQGFEYDETSQNYFISGYMSDDSASRIYVAEQNEEENAKYVTMLVDGNNHKGHTGGVAVYEDCVWVASDGYVYRLNKTDILNAENNAEIEVVDYFKTGNGADSVTVYDGKLWVGEFYMKDKFETKEEHHISVAENETNRAVAYVYEINTNEQFGLNSTIPICGLSLPQKAQGFDFTDDGKVVVSSSFSIPKSHIYVYEDVLNDENIVLINLDENTIPVYKLSSEKRTQDIEAPSMTEEIVYKDNSIFILYESACKKWKFVNRTRIKHIHSITIDEN